VTHEPPAPELGDGLNPPACYCYAAPKSAVTGRDAFRCNVCVALLLGQNEALARENRRLECQLQAERRWRAELEEDNKSCLAAVKSALEKAEAARDP
jgi:hypothetical protein